MPFINFDNFYEEVKLYCHGQPKKADGLGCIITKIDSPEAQAWIKYAADKGWPQRATFFEKMLRSGNALTMPCADPRKFDREYQPSHKPRDDFRPEFVSEHPDDRRSIAEQVRKIVHASRPPVKRFRGEPEPEAPKSPAEILAALKEKGAKEPVTISPALAGRLGLRKLDQAAE